ncbi:Nucleotidyltransferase domain protein [Sporotomaculum syntrophicum]|uniref:Nucleotidyltransferase domain protein n=1 Tax=Sporotomaculum syntrophicum TaxID=182264 RepID=A0A9D3AX81_9FIRM|nr:nucleotidyltransferase family protein [Sporotomaculum syntrophicum]KAF1086395.1 Nucleotidyltransferase domain protein [Sporotomaculum syntrophicum]
MDINFIQQKATPILKLYGVVKASIFGSYARGEQNANIDIDILIQYSPKVKKSLLTRIKLRDELKEVLQKNVDVVTEKALSSYLRDKVIKEKRDIF